MAIIAEPFVKGLFEADGSSDSILVYDGWLSLDFGGGSIALEVKDQRGNWVPVTSDTNTPAALTASGVYLVEGRGFEHRLTMSSHSSDTYYELHRGS